MSAAILIAGAGQLGSRYLQGMAKCRNTLDIYVQDISELSIQIARQRWEGEYQPSIDFHGELTESAAQHKITFESSFEKIPNKIDIAIVATNADVRPQVVKQITANNEVRYWILEKILAQSEVTQMQSLWQPGEINAQTGCSAMSQASALYLKYKIINCFCLLKILLL